MPLDGNRARIGSNADTLICYQRFLIPHIFTAYSNISPARFQLYAFIRGFYSLDNRNIAFTCAQVDIISCHYCFFILFVFLTDSDMPLSRNISHNFPSFCNKLTI